MANRPEHDMEAWIVKVDIRVTSPSPPTLLPSCLKTSVLRVAHYAQTRFVARELSSFSLRRSMLTIRPCELPHM